MMYDVLTLLSTGIQGFKSDSLKRTETKEKLILPDKEDIQTEKTHQGIIQVALSSDKSQSLSCIFEGSGRL